MSILKIRNEQTGEWTSISVVRGDVGPQGPAGEKGDKGDKGEQGLIGPQGEVGPAGPQGEQGPEGKQGPAGERGPQGERGPEGPQGPAGADGPRGEDGNSGVYVGTTEPTGDDLIWINPQGDKIDELATKQYVDDAIANSSTGSGGDGIKTVVVKANTKADLSDEVKAEIEEIWAYYKANGADAVAKQYRVVFSNTYNDYYSFIGTQWSFNSNGFYLYAGDCYTDTLTGYQSPTMLVTFNSDGSVYYCNCSTRVESGGGSNSGGDWTITDELYGDNIYNAKEIFIRMKTDRNKWIFSHFICNPVFNETLGNSYQQEQISFTTPDGMDNDTPYWYFDGWNLNIVCGYGCSDAIVAYKT